MIEAKNTYSEVYGILNMLGEDYISKLPSSLYDIIKKEKSNEYNPTYSMDVALENQNISKKALSMIALFHLNYWCNSDEEKQELRTLFRTNEEEKQRMLREKYNPDNLFKNKKSQLDIKNIDESKTNALVEVKKKNFWQTIFSKIKIFFMRK